MSIPQHFLIPPPQLLSSAPASATHSTANFTTNNNDNNNNNNTFDMAYTYFENEQDFYATDMDDRITNSDVANMIADEARTSQLIAVDADEARTSQLIGDLCNTYYDTAFRAHNISNISAGIKQLLIGKIRFSSDGDWYTCLWDDGANVHLVDSRVAEKENLEKMGTETHIVKGVGGNQQVTPLASPINVDFERQQKKQLTMISVGFVAESDPVFL
jgi:hypothetical protein